MTLTFSTDFNIGGISAIQLAPCYGFDPINPVPTLLPGYTWDDVDALPESAQLTEDQTQTEHGIAYSYGLNFAFNKKNPALATLIRKYHGTVAVALVTDNNGVQCYIGSPWGGLMLHQTTDTGKKYTDQNYVALAFTVAQPFEALMF